MITSPLSPTPPPSTIHYTFDPLLIPVFVVCFAAPDKHHHPLTAKPHLGSDVKPAKKKKKSSRREAHRDFDGSLQDQTGARLETQVRVGGMSSGAVRVVRYNDSSAGLDLPSFIFFIFIIHSSFSPRIHRAAVD